MIRLIARQRLCCAPSFRELSAWIRVLICSTFSLTSTRNHYTESVGLVVLFYCKYVPIQLRFRVIVCSFSLVFWHFLRDDVGRIILECKIKDKGFLIGFQNEKLHIKCIRDRFLDSHTIATNWLFYQTIQLKEIFLSHYLNIFQQYTQFRFQR